MTADLIAHYAQQSEASRLARSAHGRLEYLRTQELLRAALPQGARILDVGGATGIHAEWLAADGHQVHVIDLVPAHASASAALPGVTASVGDARDLPFADASVDAVLLLGPLYHLRDPADRSAALRSARRVLRLGGVLAAAGISRYLGVLEAGASGALDDALTGPLRTVIETGRYDGHLGFMPAHFHTAVELRGEVPSVGFSDVVVYGVEGPSWAALDVADGFESRCDAALRCARLVERDPLLINASAHLLAVGRR
jgi:SAM-dependent methyltransferase